MSKKTVLGRGLGALIEESGDEIRREKTGPSKGGNEIPLDLIDANPFQPRSTFDQDTMEELAASISKVGLVQPITVREMPDGRYQLITGERRLRAAKIAGLQGIPSYIRKADDQGMLEMALVENIQRDDLNAIEIAISYQRLMEECDLNQEEVSARVGKKRATVANYLRLLKLPAEIQKGLRENKITMGHARALVTMEEDPKAQIDLFYSIIDEDLSVRKTESLVNKFNRQIPGDPPEDKKKQAGEPPYEALQDQLSGFFGTAIEFRRNTKGSGKIVIPFSTDDELERIIGIFDKLKA